jgi:23S rRNA pseudouridine1911/1915/1917 synthase
MPSHALTIPLEFAGRRLDQAIAELLPEYSRTRLKDWIDAGKVMVDGQALKPRDRLVGGEAVRVEAEIEVLDEVKSEAIGLDIVYQDKHVLVLNKPAGLVVHPGAGNQAGTLQNALLHFDPRLAVLPRAGIVHRLDKDTSGLMVVARSVAAHTALVRQIEAHEVEREYEAVCVGVMTAGGTVDAPIDRHRLDRVRMAVRQGGREAVTHYRVIKRFRAHTHVRVQLETGRTHQIRVHLAHINYPIVGDGVYGGRLLIPKGAAPTVAEGLRAFRRQALHAARLAFTHPITGKPIVCEAPLPADMQGLLKLLAADAAAQARAAAARR